MRYLSKLCYLDSISYKNFVTFQSFEFQVPHISNSIHYKSSTNTGKSEKKKTVFEENQENKRHTETKVIGSLFHDITEIIGTENLGSNKEVSEISSSQVISLKNSNIKSCPQRVCGISQKNIQLENAEKSEKDHLFDETVSQSLVSEETHIIDSKIKTGIQHVRRIARERIQPKKTRKQSEILVSEETRGNLQFKDVSPIVHKITEIVRAENTVISMEECLENSDFSYDAEIVEKVLKRCFKVGHLAHRFFNWVKINRPFCHTTETYNTMIYIAGEAKDFNLVHKLVDGMDEESCPKNLKTWTILIAHYGKAKMIGEALLAFDKMRKSGCLPDETAYKSIIHALCNAGKAELAMEFYKEMVSKDVRVDMNSYKMLMSCSSGSGDIVAVKLLGDDMMKIAQVPKHEVYDCMMRSFCLSGRIDQAIELVHEVEKKNLTLHPQSFEILVRGMCRVGRIVDALEIVDIMKQNGIIDGKVYGIIIDGYLRRDEVFKAFELLSSMREFGCLPATSTYTEMIKHLFSSNEYEKLCKLYEEMLEHGLEPDTTVITTMACGHVRHNRIPEAWKAFESMKKEGIRPTRKAYSVFIKELCKVSKLDESFKLLNEMWASKINPGGDVFRMVISSLREKGKLEKIEEIRQLRRAFELCRQEPKLADLPANCRSLCEGTPTIVDIPKIPNNSFNQTLDSTQIQPIKTNIRLTGSMTKSYKDHDLQEVCRILSSSKEWCLMQEALEDSLIQFMPELVVDILLCCQRHGYAALQFFSWVGQQTGYSHNTDTYNMAIKISGSSKDFKHMRDLYVEMRRKGFLVTANTWTIMILKYGRVGLTEIALNKFKEMKIDGCKPDGSTYKYLIIFLCGKKGRKVDEAIKIFSEMTNAGYMPDKELAEIYLMCLCEMGKLSDARRCVELLCTSGFTIQRSYSLLGRSLCRAGRLEEALALAEEMGTTIDQYIYGSLVHGLLRGGRLNEALDKMETMKQQGILPTVHVYTSLIVHFLKEKEIVKALEIFRKMREDGYRPTVVTYSALIRGYTNEGMVHHAWNLFRLMELKGPFPDFLTYSMFISCLCRVGKSEEAMQLIHEMLESRILPSTVNFRTVFYGLNREGKRDLAHTVLQTKWDLMRRRKFLA